MIRVLHVISDTNIGGGGRSLLSYLEFYDRERFRMEVALPRGSALAPRVDALGVPLHEIDAMADRSWDHADVYKRQAQTQPWTSSSSARSFWDRPEEYPDRRPSTA